LAQNLEQERPRQRVKGTREIEFEQDSGCSKLVQQACRLLDKDEVVMKASSSDECVLARTDQLREPWRKTQREDLCEELCDEVNEAYGAVIAQGAGVSTLRQQGNQGLVEATKAPTSHVVQLLERGHNIWADDSPT
jgi:hypothetical protein